MTVNRTLVEIKDLVVRFKAQGKIESLISKKNRTVTAVDNVSLKIEKNEIFGLVGESGSGKTTLAKAILRLVDPKSGDISFEGMEIARMSQASLRPHRKKMQMVFQDPLSSMNPRYLIEDALRIPLRLNRIVDKTEEDRKINEVLSKVGLTRNFRKSYPHEISGGQLQRAAIARALTMQPTFLIADEAVSKLDVSVRAQILNLLKDLQEETEMTVLFITHDLYVARYLCDRVGVMYFGKLLEMGKTEELFQKPLHPYSRILIGTVREEIGIKSGFSAMAGDVFNPTEDDPKKCRFYKRCQERLNQCGDSHPATQKISDTHTVACYHWIK
jgi:oligopeptide/dipeptide ABC transporter ATP-binding protein